MNYYSASMSGSKRKRVDLLPLLRDHRDDTSLRFEDVRDITVRRSRLIRWITEPSFDHLIAGCFVRLGIGMSRSGIPVYRLCYVNNIDSTRSYCSYKLEGAKTTSKYLNVVWGSKDSAARWQMDRVSDSPPLLEEFEEWLRVAAFAPTRRHLIDKKEAITHMLLVEEGRRKYAAAAAVPRRQRFVTPAAEKYHLRIAMVEAERRSNVVEMRRICARLEELAETDRQAKEKDPRATKMAEINKRNQVENLNKDMEVKSGVKSAAYDPFSRKWTVSRNDYLIRIEDAAVDGAAPPEEEAVTGPPDGGDHNDRGAASLGGEKRLSTSPGGSDQLDDFELHNFFNKKQKTETTIGKMVQAC